MIEHYNNDSRIDNLNVKRQYSRLAKSITGTLQFKDMKRLIDANLEIANIKPEVESKDRMYINARMIMMPALLSWLVKKVFIINLIYIECQN